MLLNYRYSESTEKPEEIMYGKSTVFIRQNIAPVIRMDDEQNEYTVWTYEEAKMSHSEFREYSEKMSVRGASNISKVLDGQENGDNNQLIIMEAIADLYDLIANMS